MPGGELLVRIAAQDAGLGVTLTALDGRVVGPQPVNLDGLLMESSGSDRYGRALTAAVLTGGIGEAVRAVRGRVRIALEPGRPDLHLIRWERLQRPSDGGGSDLPLAAGPATPLSRMLFPDSQDRARDPATEWPIRIVVAISNPVDLDAFGLPPLEVEAEWGELRRSLDPLRGLVDVVRVDAPVSLDRITRALEAGPHVFHFLGHGFFNRSNGEAVLYLEDEPGRRTHPATVAEWTARLGTLSRTPHVAVLAACESAARTHGDALVGMAPGLIRAGCGAVVAMADRVGIEVAREFVYHFYRRLATHGEIDLAANEARSYLLDRGSWSWSIPTAFVERGAERLFATPPEALEKPPAAEGESLILIAEFAGKDHEDEFFEDELRRRLEEETATAGLSGVRVEWLQQADLGPVDDGRVHRLAARYGASLVIWGRYDSSGLRAFFSFTESLFGYRDPGLLREASVREEFGPERDFATVVNRDLPRRIDYFVFLTLAYVRYWAGDLDGAFVALNRAIDAAGAGDGSGPPEGLAHALFYRGNVNAVHRQDRPAAIEDYRRALRLDPSFTAAAFALGGSLRTLGNTLSASDDPAGAFAAYEDAVAAYGEALRLDPGSALAYEGRGLASFELERFEEAVDDYRAALALRKRAETLSQLGVALAKLRRPAEALTALDEAIQRAPGTGRFYFNRGLVRRSLGDETGAADDFEAYIRLVPSAGDRDRVEAWLEAHGRPRRREDP